MTIIVNQAGIEGTGIKPDSAEWHEWFLSQPEGTKIQFEWNNDLCKPEKFTAYRRKRYWEAQKRVSGKLRNTTIKPEAVTLEALKQMGYKLTAYNWAEKFEHNKSGKSEYQTIADTSSQTKEAIANLDAENGELKRQLAQLRQEHTKIEGAMKAAEELVKRQSQEISRLDGRLAEVLNQKPLSVSELIEQYETDYETIKQSLPKPSVTRDWVHFWRFKTWLESHQNP